MKKHLVKFGPRALLFQIPAEEHENLADHIKLLQESAQAMQHIIALAFFEKRTFLDSDLKAAQLGAVFVNSMAIELANVLRGEE